MPRGCGVLRRDAGPGSARPGQAQRLQASMTSNTRIRPFLPSITLTPSLPSSSTCLRAAAWAAASPHSAPSARTAGRQSPCTCLPHVRASAAAATPFPAARAVPDQGRRQSRAHATLCLAAPGRPGPSPTPPCPLNDCSARHRRRRNPSGFRASSHRTANDGASGISDGSSTRSNSHSASSGIASAPAGPPGAAPAAPEPSAGGQAPGASSSASASAGGSTSVAADADEIARRIAASRARRAASRLSYNCPACSISAATPANIARHMARCCPDLMAPDAEGWQRLESLEARAGFPSPQHDAVVALLRSAGGREQELRRRVLACVFLSGPVDEETGLPSRLEAEEAARRLGLPLPRASSLLQRAMASVPLASDAGGPPLDVVFEDEHFLAVNKPVGMHTAPIHRFTGGSVVNKVIAYLNRGRGGRPGGPPVTLLTPPPPWAGGAAAGAPPYGSLIPELMPLPGPFTLTSASSTSAPLSSSSDEDCGSGSGMGNGGAAAGSGGGSRTTPYQLEPYVLHRLDMNTSGLLLFAKRPEVVAGMHRQFRERTLSKLYVAAAVGCAELGGDGGPHSRVSFRVDAPIDRHPTQAVARRVADTGKEASTSFALLASNPAADLGPTAGGAPGLLFHERPLHHPHQHQHQGTAGPPQVSGHEVASGPGGSAAAAAGAAAGGGSEIPRGASLVLCAPHTGRTHQIRVHLHHLGHPIVGDDIYGVTGPWLGRQALHAAALRFTHPLTGRPVTLAAPLHDDMALALSALGLPQPDVAALVAEAAEADWLGLKGGGRGQQGEGRAGGRRRR
ncbi:hypothetical protein PLESTF_000281900 [Pleodorina starrii]|nr:hypothetical protein PLESTF_000281900 [Pleodorina starrii]